MRRGRCPLKVNVKLSESYPTLSNLHEITQFFQDIMLTSLPFLSESYKKNDVVFCQKSQIENVPCTNPMGIRELVLSPIPVRRVG